MNVSEENGKQQNKNGRIGEWEVCAQLLPKVFVISYTGSIKIKRT